MEPQSEDPTILNRNSLLLILAFSSWLLRKSYASLDTNRHLGTPLGAHNGSQKYSPSVQHRGRRRAHTAAGVPQVLQHGLENTVLPPFQLSVGGSI